MSVLIKGEQVNLRSAKLCPYKLNYFRVEPQTLPRQDICSYIINPRNIKRSNREKFILGPYKNLMRQSRKRAWFQASLALDIRDYQHIVSPNENMMASEIYKEVSQGKEYGQHLQAIHMPWEMMVLPNTLGVMALHNRTPARKASIVKVFRRHGAPKAGPWNRNHGFFHITSKKAPQELTEICSLQNLVNSP